MSNHRPVDAVVPAQRAREGAGFLVHRPFPTPRLAMIDPFLLLDEMGPEELGPGQARGAPDHPHRGFETVTYMLSGGMDHRDSAGNRGSIRPGDVQWMTAGRGVVHSELPSREVREEGGRQHGFQLWVNLPKRDKMMAPRYQEIPSRDIPETGTPDEKVVVRVIAGESMGRSAVIDTRTPIGYLHFSVMPGGSFEQAVPEGHECFAYVFEGELDFGDEHAGEHTLVRFGPGAGPVAFRAADGTKAKAQFLLLHGQPLGEPVARYGPFVMNSEGEIRQAIVDFQEGRMGEIAG